MYRTGHRGQVLPNLILFFIFALFIYYTFSFILYFCAKEHLKSFRCDLERQEKARYVHTVSPASPSFFSFVIFLYFAGSVALPLCFLLCTLSGNFFFFSISSPFFQFYFSVILSCYLHLYLSIQLNNKQKTFAVCH